MGLDEHVSVSYLPHFKGLPLSKYDPERMSHNRIYLQEYKRLSNEVIKSLLMSPEKTAAIQKLYPLWPDDYPVKREGN